MVSPTERRKWAVGSNQYVKRPGPPQPSPPTANAPPPDARLEDTGITWENFDVDRIKPSPQERSRHRFRAQLPELIWNTAALEGNTFTLPEVRTLLAGVTVGGKRIEEADQILALSEGYSRLDELVGAGTFELTKPTSDEIHALVARHEAIEVGRFRGEGAATGGGNVRLASGGSVRGTEHGEGGELLRHHFEDLTKYLASVEDPRRRALIYFASATRRQFYFDGNKRTARLMMTGELMANGYDIVSIPFARKLEFNNALDSLFARDDGTELLRFLSDCTLPD